MLIVRSLPVDKKRYAGVKKREKKIVPPAVRRISVIEMYYVWLIYRNPRTLSFEITFDEKSGKYGFSIKNSNDWKIFSTGPEVGSLDEVVDLTKKVLNRALDRIQKEFSNTNSASSQIYNRDGNASSYIGFLSPPVIEEVVENMRKRYFQQDN
jgi:hypothetical protein